MKLVWLNHQKDGYILNSCLIAPTPPKGMLSQSPLDEEEMAASIRKAVDDANITSRFVNVALAENQVYTKVIEMPVLSDRELGSAIYWEAEQNIPVPLNNITLVWAVLKRPEKATAADKMQVLLVGAPTLLIQKYQKIVTMAGLSISSMETEILAAVRALSFEGGVGTIPPPTLVVNIGAVSTSLSIVRNGIMVFTYSTQIGGAAINRAIATDFGLTPGQAEEYKKVYGVSGKSLGGKIGQATQPVLGSIISEVKKATSFYSAKFKDENIKQIILSGGTAKLPGIELFFASASGIETVTANPWKVLSSQEVPKEILDNAPDYTIAVGLAMKEHE